MYNNFVCKRAFYLRVWQTRVCSPAYRQPLLHAAEMSCKKINTHTTDLKRIHGINIYKHICWDLNKHLRMHKQKHVPVANISGTKKLLAQAETSNMPCGDYWVFLNNTWHTPSILSSLRMTATSLQTPQRNLHMHINTEASIRCIRDNVVST